MDELIADKLSQMLAARADKFEVVRRKPIKVRCNYYAGL